MNACARRLLLVDDEATLRRLVVLALRRSPWMVDEAESGETALEKLAAQRYDLLVVDHHLPGMSGEELIRHVRRADTDVPIVVITAHSSAEAAAEMLNLGISGFLEKPFADVGDLTRLIDGLPSRTVLKDAVKAATATAAEHFKRANEALAASQSLDLVLVSARAELQGWFVSAYGSGNDRARVAGALEEGMRQVASTAPQLCLLDSALCDDLSPWVAHCRATSPETVVAVVGERPSVRGIVALIAAGTRALVSAPLASTSVELDSLIAGVRRGLRPRPGTPRVQLAPS